MGVALAPMVSAYVAAFQMGSGAQRLSTAVMLANWKVDEIRAIEGYEDVSAVSNQNFGTELDHSEYDPFYYDVTIIEEISNEDFSAKEVGLKVRYSPLGSDEERSIRCSNLDACEYDNDYVIIMSDKEPPE